MFFRREKAKTLSFEDHTANLEKAGFRVHRLADGVRAERGFCAAEVYPGEAEQPAPRIGDAGVLLGDEIAVLVSRGYQMTLETRGGKKMGAQSAQLKALHAFQEDLREALGLTSLYNLSLGTVATRHDYDRLEERDGPPAQKPWELKKQARA
ncbi:MAG: hypothetical protein KIT83_16705 [Bryobacterales bacterium]|nr:hypothetical protein [Bryobacterales bacterium]